MVLLILFLALATFAYFTYMLLSPFFSPTIPSAHFTSPYSSLWLNHLRRNGKTGVNVLTSLHERLGPILRLSPTEISLSSLSALRTIYTGNFRKNEFYHQFANYDGTRNMVSMVADQEHSARKKILSPVYSKSFIHGSVEIREFSTRLVFERLGPVLRDAPRGEEVRDGDKLAELNAYALNQALGADFTSAFLMGMGSCTGFIQNQIACQEFMGKWKIKSRELPGHQNATQQLEEFVLDLIRKSECGNVDDGNGVVRSQLENHLASQREEIDSINDTGIYQQQKEEDTKALASEIFDNLIAGIETARITLTYIQYQLSLLQNASLQRSLRAELRTLDPLVLLNTSDLTNAQALPSSRQIDALPLLEAILKETLRVYPASPASLPRLVPTGGTTLHGFKIPAGTVVGISSHVLHRNESIFEDAGEWVPRRWLVREGKEVGKEEERIGEMNRYFWAFGSGARMCIGSHYVVFMLKLITVALYTSFETRIVDAEGIEQEDAFLAGPVGEKLVLGIRAVA